MRADAATSPPARDELAALPLPQLVDRLVGGEPRLLRKIASRAVRSAAFGSGLTPSLTRARRNGAVILMYHKVELRKSDGWGRPVVSAEAFEAHCRYLVQHAEVIPLREVVAHLREGAPLPPRAVALTFDDGYRNNWLAAAPILARHGLPATFFVVTGLCGSEGWLWAFEVEEMARRSTLAALCEGLGDPVLDLLARARLPSRRGAVVLVEYLKTLGPEARDTLLIELRQRVAVTPDPENRLLSWDEVAALAKAGFEIGSHTVSHAILTAVPASAVEREIAEAKTTLLTRLGRPPAFFAYPNGSCSPEVRSVVQRHHEAAVTVEQGENRHGTDVFALRRVCAPVAIEDLAYQLAFPARG